MGEIEEVSGAWANVNHPSVEVDDTAVATIRFRSGGIGAIITSVAQKPGIYTKVQIHGTSGASIGVQTDTGATFVAGMSGIAAPPFNDIWTIPGEEDLLAGFQAEDRRRFEQVDGTSHYHRLQIQDFLQAVLGGRRPMATGDEGRIVVAMFTAIYRSQRERRPIPFPVPAS
jgi:predicted dehydrogenase